MKIKSNRHGLLASTTFCSTLIMGLAVSSVFSGMAQAQEAEAKPAEEPKEITVVGSRIRKDTYNSASPITVVTRDEATAAGLTSTAAILQGTSVTGGNSQINNAYGGFVTDGGPGANTIGLRGLGPGRTLVMINGRRVSPAGTRGAVGAADLNVLPNALIGRVEVLRDGASAIYGSDAIGGVVNVITKKVQGVHLDVLSSNPVHNGGEQYRLSLVAGKTWGRLTVQGSAEYYEQTDLTLGDRDWTKCNQDYRFNKATGVTTDYIDPLTGQSKCYPITGTGSNGVTINTLGTATTPGVAAVGNPVLAGGYNRWRPNSSVTTGLVGYEGVSGGNNNVRDTFDPRTLNRSLISPAKILTSFGEATYQLPEFFNSEVYGELLLHNRQSTQVGYRQLSLDYPVASPLLPAGINAIVGNLSGAGTSLLFAGPIKARAFVGFGNDTSSQELNFIKATGGIRGDFPLLAGWQYDSFVTYSKSDASYTFQSFLTDRMSQSVQVATPVAGVAANLIRTQNGVSVTCASNNASPTTASCVPAPFLSSAVIGGVLPSDWTNYMFRPVTGKTAYEEITFSFDVNGSLFALPAGDLDAAVGVEFRKAKINDQPDPNSVAGNLYNLTSAVPTVGEDSVIEAYAELQVPVLKDLPFAKTLNLELAGRYTDYDSYGADTTYKAGVVWTPFDFLTLRATQGTSYRAPALYEQFQGASSGFLAASGDPCNNYSAPGVDPIRAANCAAEGLVSGFNATSSIAVITAGGAAQGLSAETSENLTIGSVFKPTFLPKDVFGELAFAVDYFDIKVNNQVSRVGASNLLVLCYDDPNFRTSGAYCPYSVRNSATKNLTVYDSYTNVSKQTVKGYDYSVRWEKTFEKFKVLFNGTITKYTEQGTATFDFLPLQEYNGSLRFPKYTGDFATTVTYNKWKFRYGVEWVGEQESYTLLGIANPAADPRILDVDDYFLQRASVQYSAPDWTFTMGVRNLADVTPPNVSFGSYNRVGNSLLYSGYDYVGRQIFLNFTKKF